MGFSLNFGDAFTHEVGQPIADKESVLSIPDSQPLWLSILKAFSASETEIGWSFSRIGSMSFQIVKIVVQCKIK